MRSTRGWQKADFYGGDDAGDSETDSDEDLVFEEARRLEELRANRLKGSKDVLADLIGPGAAEGINEKEAESKRAASTDFVVGSAHFEAVFAAEKEHVERDLSQLSEEKRRGLIKKEAPELVPLLKDFEAKLTSLKELLPLLAPSATAMLPASGVSYLQSRAMLLLNTLANLSFYLVLRAEGSSLQAHPVVSQLVWLRELHEKLEPLNMQLGPKLRQASRSLSRLGKSAAAKGQNGQISHPTSAHRDQGIVGSRNSESAPSKEQVARHNLSLRERLERLRASAKTVNAPSKATPPKGSSDTPVKDLFRLPRRRKASDSRPLDVDDPVLGTWAPSATLAEQLGEVQQQLSDQAARAKVVSSDHNVDAKPWQIRASPSAKVADPGRADGRAAGGAIGTHEDDEIIKEARKAAGGKKDKAAAEKAKKLEERLAQQYHPEKVVDGRRKISTKIDANRGMTRIRKKYSGNARVAYRKKYDKAEKKRRGNVQEVREAAPDGVSYPGENSVRTHLKKSQKLG